MPSLGFRLHNNTEVFANAARSTDKVHLHSYQLMYGMFLIPAIQQHKAKIHSGFTKKKFKFLDIGIGCLTGDGPGKSVFLWKQLMKNIGEIWMALGDIECIEKFVKDGHMQGFSIVTGSQDNVTEVQAWVNETKGEFDVIIDDGGHANHHVLWSFNILFEQALNPGGLYFIEDLQVGHDSSPVSEPMTSILQSWIDELTIRTPSNPSLETLRKKYPKPKDVEWIFCQREACVIGKAHS